MACLQIKEAKRGKFTKCGNIDIEWGVEDAEDSEGLYCTPEEFGQTRVRMCMHLCITEDVYCVFTRDWHVFILSCTAYCVRAEGLSFCW